MKTFDVLFLLVMGSLIGVCMAMGLTSFIDEHQQQQVNKAWDDRNATQEAREAGPWEYDRISRLLEKSPICRSEIEKAMVDGKLTLVEAQEIEKIDRNYQRLVERSKLNKKLEKLAQEQSLSLAK